MKKLLSVFLASCLVISVLTGICLFASAEGESGAGAPIRILRDGEYLSTTYTDFKLAYNASKAGDVIELDEGTYALDMEPQTYPRAMSIAKDITVRGPAGGYATFVPGEWDLSMANSHKFIAIGGTACTLENIKLDGQNKKVTSSGNKGLNGLFTSCTDLKLNNVIITNFDYGSCLQFNSTGAHVTTANGLYCHTSATSIGQYSNFHTVDVSGGTLVFNSGVIHGTMITDGEGVITQNAVNTLGPFNLGSFITTINGYMSDTYAAANYSSLGYTYKSKLKTFLKNNSSAFTTLVSRYNEMSPSVLVGGDPLGNVYLDTVSGLKTLSSDAGNSAATAIINDVIAKGSAIKANSDNSLSSLSYKIGDAEFTAVASFDSGTNEYNVTLPYTTSPTATITLSAVSSSIYGDVVNNTPVTLVDGTGSATVDGWAYAASPKTKTYKVNFTVPKYSLSFSAGAGGSLAGNTELALFYGASPSELLPSPVADPGYKFVKWSPSIPEAVTADGTFAAEFEKDASQWATVTFSAGEHGELSGNSVTEVLKNTAWEGNITVPGVTPDEDYIFDGWSEQFPDTITDSITFVACYSIDRAIVIEPVSGQNDGKLRNVLPGDSKDLVIEYLIDTGVITASDTAYVTTATGEAVSENDIICTGMILTINDKAYDIVIDGDVNCDGSVNADDSALAARVAVDEAVVSDAAKTASDIDKDGAVDVVDVFLLQKTVGN